MPLDIGGNRITSQLLAALPNPGIITSGLVLNLDASNIASYPGSGTTWYDLSSQIYIGTLYNGTSYSNTNGGGIVFDGVDDYVDLNSNNIITGVNPFTVECLYTIANASVNGAALFTTYGTGYVYNSIWISGQYGIYTSLGNVYYSDAPLGVGTYYLTCTKDSSGNCILYRNAKPMATGSVTASISAQANFRLGADTNNTGGAGNERLTGTIYNLRVYNKALSPAEIQQNFNALRGRYGI